MSRLVRLLIFVLLGIILMACSLFSFGGFSKPTATPTAVLACTAPACKPGERLECASGACPGGCGMVCRVQSPGTVTRAPLTPETSIPTLSKTPPRTPSVMVTTAVPQIMCTPPLCKPGEVFNCPSGNCPGGCGTGCATPTPRSGENTGYKEPPPTYYPCPNSLPSRLMINQYAVVAAGQDPNRLRFSPNANANIIGSINPGELVQLTESPQCSNGWIWWRVKSLLNGAIGWTAEGDKTTYWLEPRFTNSGYVGGMGNVGFVYPTPLARSSTGKNVPASNSPGAPYFEIYPAYTQFSFDGYPLAGTLHKPSIQVYPVAEYIKMNPGAGKTVDALREILRTKPVNPSGALPFLPIWNAGQIGHTRPVYLEFQNGSGIRYLTQFAQSTTVINNRDLFYTFQGLTKNEGYYINAIFPVSHGILPADSSNPPPGLTWQDLENRYKDYVADVMAKIDAQYPASFKPDLSLFDITMMSLQVR